MELSKYVWHLKENTTDFTIKWSALKILFPIWKDQKDIIYV